MKTLLMLNGKSPIGFVEDKIKQGDVINSEIGELIVRATFKTKELSDRKDLDCEQVAFVMVPDWVSNIYKS